MKRVCAVVPTLGLSPDLESVLRSLRSQGTGLTEFQLDILLVVQGEAELDQPILDIADEILRSPQPLGFARATNLGLDSAHARHADLIATVNDDAVPEANWLSRLIDHLESRSHAVAAQGLVVQAPETIDTDNDETCLDGAGITFNRWWQAQQLLRNHSPSRAPSDPTEIFGVSATAAVFLRSALDQASTTAGLFDERLDTYYEDVDLACRLRAHGGSAWLVPEARAVHRGSTSGPSLGRRRAVLLYSNRWLVLARSLGRAFPICLPRGVLRDVLDVAQGRVGGVALGLAWLRALRLFGDFARIGPPRPSSASLRQFDLARREPA